jgi:septum formation topological specificity factor MinE
MDMADLRAKRPAIQRTALKARVQALLRTDKARTVAAATFKTLRKTCAEVIQKRGAAARG